MKHSYLTMWFPHPSTPDYAFRHEERFVHNRTEPFDERYPNISGIRIHNTETGSVRIINKYECFYETDEAGVSAPEEMAWFVLHALAEGYTMAAPPLVLPNTKPAAHYKNGVTVYFFLEVPPHKLNQDAQELQQQDKSQPDQQGRPEL